MSERYSPAAEATTSPPQPRPVRSRKTEPTEAHVEQLAVIGEILMGAAYADGEKAGIEVVAIGEQLKEFVEAELLPVEVRRRLDRFDPQAFDPVAASQCLTFTDDSDRMALIQLIATVIGADSILHPSEIDYLRGVAAAIGLDPERIRLTPTEA